jgi:hypothetical protein
MKLERYILGRHPLAHAKQKCNALIKIRQDAVCARSLGRVDDDEDLENLGSFKEIKVNFTSFDFRVSLFIHQNGQSATNGHGSSQRSIVSPRGSSAIEKRKHENDVLFVHSPQNPALIKQHRTGIISNQSYRSQQHFLTYSRSIAPSSPSIIWLGISP